MGSVTVLTVGSKRPGVEILKGGETYELDEGKNFLRLDRDCSIETTETLRSCEVLTLGKGWHYKLVWVATAWHTETLQTLPTRWERFKAWIMRRPAPRPQAVTLLQHERKSPNLRIVR